MTLSKRRRAWVMHCATIRVDRVLRGTQPIEQMQVLAEYADLVEEELRRRGVLWERKDGISISIDIGRRRPLTSVPQHHYLLFVHPHLRDVARRYLGLPHDAGAVERWIHGKMFGTSEEEIARWETATPEEDAGTLAMTLPDYTRACSLCGADPPSLVLTCAAPAPSGKPTRWMATGSPPPR